MLGFSWLIGNFMLSAEFQAGTITTRRLRILNELPFGWRVAVVAVVVVLLVAAGVWMLKHVVWTRVASIGDEGIEVLTPWRVARARWDDFTGIKVFKKLGTATLLFGAPADGSPAARRISLPAKILGADNRAMLVDMQSRFARPAGQVSHQVHARSPLFGGAPLRTQSEPCANPSVAVAPDRPVGFGDKSDSA